MGMLAGGSLPCRNAQGQVLLSASWNLQSYDPGALSSCGITFESDGSLTPNYNDTSNLPSAANWWTGNPEADIGALYEVSLVSVTTGGFDTGPAVGEWTSLASAVTWTCRVTAKAAPDTQVANGCTFAIRPAGGGATIDSVAGCNHSASN